MGRVEHALKCALSYLLFHEGEEFMAENVEYYREVLGFDTKPDKVTQLNKPSLDRVGENVYCLHMFTVCSGGYKLLLSVSVDPSQNAGTELVVLIWSVFRIQLPYLVRYH